VSEVYTRLIFLPGSGCFVNAINMRISRSPSYQTYEGNVFGFFINLFFTDSLQHGFFRLMAATGWFDLSLVHFDLSMVHSWQMGLN
jgi:hypothetical protein